MAVPATGDRPLSAAGPVEPGTTFGRYRIVRLLGLGGMGAVYQAWDEELSVVVALKVIRPEVARDPDAARALERRFKQELLLARQVTHENVVRIHDLGEVDGIKYITMPFIEGEDLASILQREGTLAVPAVMKIARTTISGLAAAHAAGVVHRDLKPANLMIDSTGASMIMDFGIARSSASHSSQPNVTIAGGAAGAQTVMGAVIGTVEYMAPEQAKAEKVDHRADIYAFGLILYDALLGRRRHERAESVIAELTSRMLAPPPPVRKFNQDLPAPLERIISRCLEPNPDARYQTTHEVVEAIEALDDQGHPRPIARRITRRLVATVAAVFVALLGATWWIAAGRRTAVAPREPVSVLIADFDNRTNDPVFQGALEQALGLAIEGASFITTYSRDDARKLAKQLKPDAPLDAQTARAISAREGIKYILAGAIEMRGSRYQVSVKAIDPADGHEVASGTGTASEKAAVLKTLSGLAVQIRKALGDTKPRGESLAAMDPVTTVSLEALQAYSRGQDLALAGKSDDALKVFEEAIAKDPSLGRAYIQIAVIHGNQKRDRLAEENFQKGLKYVDRMTEREKYRSLGSYYLLVSHDYPQAINNYKEMVARYPADNSGHANLAFASLMTGQFQEAVKEGRQAIEIYPKNLLQRTNYSMYAMYAGDFKLAIEQANIVLEANPKFEYPILTLARANLGLGDVKAAQAAYARLRETSTFGASLASLGEADIALYRGDNRAAIRILEAGIADDLKASMDPAPKYIALAEAKLAVGDRAGAAKTALKAAADSRQESVLVPAARLLIELGHKDEPAKIAERLRNTLQPQAIGYARLLDGEQFLKANQLASALDALRDSKGRNDSWFTHYALGRTYFQAGQFAAALQEFDWCFTHEGLAGDVFIADSSTARYFPPAQYWLARAQEAMGTKDAQQNYREFATLREHADPPDPLVADALRRLGTAATQH